MDNSIKKKIEFYCAYQERCKMEVAQKLRKLGIFGDELEKYICDLIDNDFLNEKRFSECYVRGKFNNNNWGRIKIIRELKSRKISIDNIKIFIDASATMYILGSKIDYIDNGMESGFVFSNPNEKGRCGCGESFSV